MHGFANHLTLASCQLAPYFSGHLEEQEDVLMCDKRLDLAYGRLDFLNYPGQPLSPEEYRLLENQDPNVRCPDRCTCREIWRDGYGLPTKENQDYGCPI